jgi:predicted dehydrogenase
MDVAVQREIGVGVVGGARTSWASISHLPAINDLSGLRLAAVATRNEQSAREAADAFGADRWYSDPIAMMRDDRIDIVTVSVVVPSHRELVLAALEAGKAVFCEAPLGRNVAEAEEMMQAARSRSLHTAIGLQGRHSPAVRRAAELVSSGKIGRPLNARIVSQTFAFGPDMPAAHELYIKRHSGTNLLTVTGGHTLDIVEAVLGRIREVDARAEIRWPTVRLIETGAETKREVADYIGILGKTASGAAFTAEIEAGVPQKSVRFSFEVRGSDGWLSLTTDHPHGCEVGDIKLRTSVAHAVPDVPAVSDKAVPDQLREAAINVGEVYTQLARDLREGTHTTPGFRHALHNSRLMEAVRHSAETGVRQRLERTLN